MFALAMTAVPPRYRARRAVRRSSRAPALADRRRRRRRRVRGHQKPGQDGPSSRKVRRPSSCESRGLVDKTHPQLARFERVERPKAPFSRIQQLQRADWNIGETFAVGKRGSGSALGGKWTCRLTLEPVIREAHGQGPQFAISCRPSDLGRDAETHSPSYLPLPHCGVVHAVTSWM